MTSSISRSLTLLVCFVAVGIGPAISGQETSSVKYIKAKSHPPQDIAELMGRVRPWIVAIKVDRSEDIRVRRAPKAGGEARDYFKRPDGYVTGLLMDRKGHIYTSYYNVAGKIKSIKVRLASGEEHGAKLVAKDRIDDVALLRIESDEPIASKGDWSAPPFADAVMPKSGEVVFAIGRSPDPQQLTITQGIISAGGRNGDRGFQTDAKLNYGNVGGPLVNLNGRIVGIAGFVGHTYPQWGLNSGIGFGTTTKTLQLVFDRLAKGEDISPPPAPFLGVVSKPEDLQVKGARIAEVLPESSAAKSGIKVGDIIVEIGGVPIVNFNQLRHEIYNFKVGQTVDIQILRDGKKQKLELKLGERPRS